MPVDSRLRNRFAALRFLVAAAALGAAALSITGAAGGLGVPLIELGPAAWSPDGQKIVFARSANELTQIVVMSRSGTDRKVIWAQHKGERGWDRLASLSYSPDGRRLAFGAYPRLIVTGRSGRTIRECRLDFSSFEWGPASERLVTFFGPPYVGVGGDGPLTVLSVEDCGKHYVTRGHDTSPTWSPDGKWVAFVRGRGAQRIPGEICPCDVYVVRARHRELEPDRRRAGGGLARLTRRGAEYPLWSPRGDRIAFESRSGWQIWSVGGNHRLDRLLSRIPAKNVSSFYWLPRWSRDGKKFLFLRPGAIARILEQRHANAAIFSPDGRRILFETTGADCGKDGIWLLRVATLHLKHLVKPCPAK
jgi:Tol biopolymer transport system component